MQSYRSRSSVRRSKDLCVIFAAMDSSGVDTEPLLQGVQYPPLYSPALSSAFRPDSSSRKHSLFFKPSILALIFGSGFKFDATFSFSFSYFLFFILFCP